MLVVGIVAWVLLCFLIGGIASNLGQSRTRYFVLSLLLSPIIGALILAFVHTWEPRPPQRRPDPGGITEADVARLAARLNAGKPAVRAPGTAQSGGRRTPVTEALVSETPVAVVDFETTGLNAGIDRVVEVSVVRAEPGQAPKMVLNTLVNPRRRMAATEIHGITDEDVRDAPPFEEISSAFMDAVAGAVVASYNIYFDLRFLEDELSRIGVDQEPAHVCLMYFRPLLGLGSKCSLEVACREHRIPRVVAHQAAADALSGAQLWLLYLAEMQKRKIRTFGDLQGLKSYKFLDSLDNDLLHSAPGRESPARLKPRSMPAAGQYTPAAQDSRRTYWEALKVALSDEEISDVEYRSMAALRSELKLSDAEVRAIHAKTFADLLGQTIQDKLLDEKEVGQIRTLHQNLVRLGWAPGL